MRFLYLTLLFLTVAWNGGGAQLADTICNRGTKFECPCASCLDASPFRSDNPTSLLEWISVAFAHCSQLRGTLVEEKIRAKIAGWVNEECGSVLNCRKEGMDRAVQACNVVVGDFSCEPKRNNRILLGLVKNCSENFDNDIGISQAVEISLFLPNPEIRRSYYSVANRWRSRHSLSWKV
ncbi:hypothetical protein L596_020062 [Steinernema carpocapsae]|uniref:Uncharacterized protein n=1 Tax=Steinernema carpocapsae TaxID=34508 RepID=A0A4U5MSE3_STECR|nr:hypothetical protein L596_020062 [Steinernema carpocapsae]